MTSRTGQDGQSIDKIEITNPGFGYTVPPNIIIRSQNVFGTGAAATSILTSDSLGKPNIINVGSGYPVEPTVTFSAPSVGTTAIGRATINNNGQVTSIRYTNAGAGYTGSPTVTLSAPSTGTTSTNYLYKEVVRGVSTGTTAHVSEWDAGTGILKVTNSSGNFAVGELVVGMGTQYSGSDASYLVSSISDQDEYDEYADNIEIESSADSIIDFTERNPFGEF